MHMCSEYVWVCESERIRRSSKSSHSFPTFSGFQCCFFQRPAPCFCAKLFLFSENPLVLGGDHEVCVCECVKNSAKKGSNVRKSIVLSMWDKHIPTFFTLFSSAGVSQSTVVSWDVFSIHFPKHRCITSWYILNETKF